MHSNLQNTGPILNSRYEIMEKLGSGGFGSVYRGKLPLHIAIDLMSKKEVAVKLVT